MNSFIKSAALSIVATLCFTSAQSQTILSNLGNAASGRTQAEHDFFSPTSMYTIFSAQSFTTGSGASTLNSLSPSFVDGSGNGLSIGLYSDNSGTVGNKITSLTGPSVTTSGVFAFTPVAPTSLAANSTYWWVATVPTDPTTYRYDFDLTTDTSSVSSSGWTVNACAILTGINGWQIQSSSAILFSVNATLIPVPEPSAVAIITLGGLTSLVCLRHRRY